MENGYWKWKDIEVAFELIGDDITQGTGMYEKEYQYIKIPLGYGYDNYCFLLSKKLVKYHPLTNKWSFSICSDMKIELFYDPECRESNKRYKRYKMTGVQIYESIFKIYEIDYARELEQKFITLKRERAKRERKVTGDIVYGRYMGNNYSDEPDGYSNYFFRHKGIYLCVDDRGEEIHQKVQNVQVTYVIMENVSKHFYRETKNMISQRLSDWLIIRDKLIKLDETKEVLSQIGIECNEEFESIHSKLQDTADSIFGNLLNELRNWR